MQLKNSNAVALERRLDLASLFCMIGRHGPAVALAVIAMVSVLAGFIIYRTVRGKRRKATAMAAAAAADGDGAGPEVGRDASVIRPEPGPGPQESHSSAESTDVSNEDLSDTKDDADLFQSDLKIRHRRAAAATAEKKPPPYSPPQSHIPRPDNKHTAADNTEAMTAEQDSDKVAEASHNLRCDTCAEAEMEVDCADDCHQSATEDIAQDAIEEVCDNRSCLKGTQLMEVEKVFKGEEQEYENVNVDKISDEKTRQEEENFQRTSNNQVCFNQTPPMSENVDRRRDDETTPQTHSWQEPIVHVEDTPVTYTCYGKDEDFVEENHHADSTDDSNYSSSHFSPEGEEKKEGEDAEVECVVQQSLEQPATWSSIFEKELNLPPSLQDQWDDVTDEVTLLIRDSDREDAGGLAGEVIEEDHIRTAAEFTIHPPQSDQQQPQIEQTDENSFTCSEEEGVPPTAADQEKIVGLSSALHCLIEPVKVDNGVGDLSSVNSDTRKTESSGIVDFPNLPLDCQQPQSKVKDDEIAPPLDKDTDLTALDSDLLEKEIQCQNNETGEFVVLAEERAEAFDKSSVAAGPDTTENLTASLPDEEMPQLPSICQDKKIDNVEINETFDDTIDISATDADVCNKDRITTPAVFEEISRPDLLSFSQYQHNVLTRNDENFSELTISSAPITTDDLNPTICQFHLSSFEQSELRDNDKDGTSSPGVGEESGISSMAVSPDLHGPGNEFDLTIDNMMLPAMDCHAQSEERTEAQCSLSGDAVAVPIINEDKEGMMVGPYPLSTSQQPPSEHTDAAKYESYAANEDMFGHEIENRYHRAMEQLMVQIAASAMILTKETEDLTGVKTVVEVVEIKEKDGVTVAKKVETEAEKEKEEDYEKTNISIMEATMDNNEWITDSNNQVLPWMNLSVQPLAQDHPKTEQLPPEDHQDSSSVTGATCTDTDTPPSTEVKQDTDTPPSTEVKQDTNTPPSTEVKQTSTLSLVDENTESNKKVVAVQPMPQNVNVTFRIHYVTHSPYQTVAVTGDQQELGNWKEFIPLERAKDGNWATVVSLPAESHVEWKFVVMDKGEVFRWEECSNRLLDTGYGDDLIVHKWWGFL